MCGDELFIIYSNSKHWVTNYGSMYLLEQYILDLRAEKDGCHPVPW